MRSGVCTLTLVRAFRRRMRSRTKLAFLLTVGALAAVVLRLQAGTALDVVWLDFDMKNIAEPKERAASIYENFFREQVIEEGKQDLDVPRWFRAFAGNRKPAMDVNAVDEVPDSSWYTNR